VYLKSIPGYCQAKWFQSKLTLVALKMRAVVLPLTKSQPRKDGKVVLPSESFFFFLSSVLKIYEEFLSLPSEENKCQGFYVVVVCCLLV
jgi:hypothetical protein